VFNLLVASGINLFDTADSYGESHLCTGWVPGSVQRDACLCATQQGHLHETTCRNNSENCNTAAALVNFAVPRFNSHACPCFCTGSGTGKLNGRSEQLLGQFLREYPGSDATADNVRIATKLAAYPWRLAPQQV
jgi:aryl-alcohol dehydrogenase-like predicted oxidoreductase